MRILGVDTGLQITGYGLIDERKGSFKLIEAGVLTTSSKDRIESRLNKLHESLFDIIKEYKPKVLVLEKLYSHYKHPTTSILMGHARGVICFAAGECDIPLVSYPAKRIKKAVTGTGGASKFQVQRMVTNMLNLKEPVKYNDVTDALALAIGHAYMEKAKV